MGPIRRRVLVAVAAIIFGACTDPLGLPAEAQDSGTVDVEIERSPGGVLVFADVRIEGEGPFRFVVDTGASRSVVLPRAANQIGLEEAEGAGQIAGPAVGGQAALVDIQRWSTGGVDLPSGTYVRTQVNLQGQQDIDGLLGSDVLSAFGTVTFDYDQQSLALGE